MNSFRRLIDNQEESYFYLQKSGLIEYVNPAFQEKTGFSLDACIQTSISKLLSIAPRKEFEVILNTVLTDNEQQTGQFEIRCENGSKKEAIFSLYAEGDKDKIHGVSGKIDLVASPSSKPYSNINATAMSLHEIEEKYKALYNLTFEGIVIHDRGILVDANPAFLKMLGYTKNELLGEDIVTKFVLPEYHQRVYDAMKTENAAPYEVLARAKDGKIVNTEVESRKIDFGNRSVRVTSIRDITARKQAEAQLKESEERYKLLSNLSFEGIILHNNGILVDVNQSFVDMVGYTAEELIGTNIIPLAVLPDYHERVNDAILHFKKTPYEVKAKRRNGEVFVAEVQSRILNYHGETLRVTAIRDLTWRKEAEQKLRENEEELDMFFSKSGDGFCILKVDKPIYWDRTTNPDLILDRVFSSMYLTKINDAMINQFHTTRKELSENASQRMFRWNETEGRKLTLKLLHDGSVKSETKETKNDNTNLWFEGHYVLLYDEQGRIRGCIGVRRDVTDRKNAEDTIRRHNEELKKTNHELDTFVYRVSHDLKAPISSSLGLINIARLETEITRKNECIKMIEQSMVKLDSFIVDILDYSRNSRISVQAEKIDLELLIDNILASTHFLHKEQNIQIEKYIHASHDFYSDKNRLVFIFNNLISNAIRFADGDKQLNWLKVNIDILIDEVKITFADNGIGIEEEHIGRIFEMFYRGTEITTGSGLGLYIVKEAIEKLSGSISVQSEIHQGTTFELIIPNLNPA